MSPPSSHVPPTSASGSEGHLVDDEDERAGPWSVAKVRAVEGPAIVEAIRAGDPSGLAAAYDQYGDRLYGYCASLLRDPDLAADALHDTLLVAGQRIDQLRDPERLRAWLYAIARNECLRQLRLRRRSVSLEAAAEVSDESVDLDAGPRRRELRALVQAAAAGLSPRDREVLELALRHDLDPAELSATLGVSQSHARALLSRARDQLERAVGAVLVARGGRDDCPELAALLAGWDGQMTALLRKRMNRHLESCAVCAESRRRLASAPALLSALPLLVPPPDLRARVLNDAFDPKLVAYRAGLGRRAGRMDSDGFPLQRRPLWPPRPLVAAAMIALALGAGILVYLPAPGQVRSLAGVPPAVSASPTESGGALGSGPSGGPTPTTAGTGTASHRVAPASGARQASPSAQPRLVVPAEVDLQGSSTSQVQISARGGDLDWTATVSDPSVTVRPAKGHATTAANTSAAVSIPAVRGAGRATITFTYAGGSASTVVTWGRGFPIIVLPSPTPTLPPPR
jgi:RNA polymerase sigma factor (sigma-70 family)